MINTVPEAISFAIAGFLIVMAVLCIVAVSIKAVMKIESVFFKEKTAQPPAEALNPVVLVLISAAVAAYFKTYTIQNIRIVKRGDSTWSELGRTYNPHDLRR